MMALPDTAPRRLKAATAAIVWRRQVTTRMAALSILTRPHLRRLAAPLQDTARAASAIFLCGSWQAGALLGACLLFMPRYFMAAAAACMLGAAAAQALRLPAAMRRDGTLLYNVLLSALAVAWITRGADLSLPAAAALLAIVTIYTLVLSAALWHWFPLRAGLPPLSIAFAVVFGTLLTFFPRWAAASSLLDLGLPAEPGALPFVAASFFRSMGTVLFLPNVWAGVAVTAALLLWSRVALVNAAAGYAGGILVVRLLEACGLQWLGWSAGHNYLLAGMALGAVYFVPSRASLALAAAAGGVAALHAAAVQHFLRGSGWEYLPLPYLLTVWSLLCALRLRETPGSLLPTAGLFASPEAAAAATALADARFPHRNEVHVLLPAAREVTVTQGFDDKLSHRGDWRHALDFEVHDAAGHACPPGCDDDLARYHTQGMDIRAPGSGEILRVCDGVPDNPPGSCNFAQNWGNHLILRLDYGGIVKLAHFAQNGILVKAGQRVAAGDLLGRCGNSGRSPVPHLHLHAQASAEIGAPTVPFCLANFFTRTSSGLRWNFASVPKAGDRIAPAAFSATVLGTLAHFAPGRAHYRTGESADAPAEELAVTLDEAGRYVFTSGEESLTAVLGLHALQVIHTRLTGRSQLLRLLSFALPAVPFAYQNGMSWEDHVAPAPAIGRALGRRLLQAVAAGLAPYRRFRAQRVVLCHTAPPTPQRLQIGAALMDAPADLPPQIELTLEPVRGLVALTARFRTRTVSYLQTSFLPTLPNGAPE